MLSMAKRTPPGRAEVLLRQLRENAGLTFKQMAEECGVGVSTYQGYELGSGWGGLRGDIFCKVRIALLKHGINENEILGLLHPELQDYVSEYGGDITERLAAIEEKLAGNTVVPKKGAVLVMDGIIETNWKTDASHHFTWIDNASYQAWVGLNPGIIGQTRWELAKANVKEKRWRDHIRLLNAHRRFEDFEFESMAIPGQKVTVTSSGVPLFDPDTREFLGYRGNAIVTRSRTKKAG